MSSGLEVAACRATSASALLLLVLICPLACAANPAGEPADNQNTASSVVLAPGESHRIPETDLTIVFETVVDDSRCPSGVTCIREGDAAVRLRIEKPATPPSSLTLHTSGPGNREAVVDNVTLRLVEVKPYPSGDSKPRPEEYRVTLLIQRT